MPIPPHPGQSCELQCTLSRRLNEYDVFIRHNDAVDILDKVKTRNEESIVDLISTRNPFGFPTNYNGEKTKKTGYLSLISSKGKTYVHRNKVVQGQESVDKYKVLISRVTSEHAGEPDKTGKFKVISRMQILSPEEICTDSYLVAYPHDELDKVKNFSAYLKSKFVRFIILQGLTSINLPREKYGLVPVQDFSKPWTDAELYAKYDLNQEEIDFIESMIRPMDTEGGDDA
ncbi:MAG: hypothetical protein GXZ04_01980 [Clostridiales bacterium]|nr:hypothetical protein [Clostridiales bacterium]